jgi:succinate dehydrogenase / fumarate reductase, iron-sulfur subunit
MKINGIPRLACYTKISELDDPVVVCEPLPNFPVIRDLVTDFSQFFNHHKSINPYIQNLSDDKTEVSSSNSHRQSREEVDKFLQFSYCIKCGLCYSACPTVATDTKFPGPQALAQLYRYYADSRDAGNDRLNIVDDRHGLWRCHFAGSCSKVCPKGVDPALGIQLLRSYMLGISKDKRNG